MMYIYNHGPILCIEKNDKNVLHVGILQVFIVSINNHTFSGKVENIYEKTNMCQYFVLPAEY